MSYVVLNQDAEYTLPPSKLDELRLWAVSSYGEATYNYCRPLKLMQQETMAIAVAEATVDSAFHRLTIYSVPECFSLTAFSDIGSSLVADILRAMTSEPVKILHEETLRPSFEIVDH